MGKLETDGEYCESLTGTWPQSYPLGFKQVR
jgi:hypothetical protein